MNYFAHGIRFLDRPYFLAGTAVPDWLSASDRRVRMRQQRVEPFAQGEPSPETELAAGILQHLADDHWFHETAAFHQANLELTLLFRAALPAGDDFRPGFLGHIALELILDGILHEHYPDLMDRYFEQLATVEAVQVERSVNWMARQQTTQLAPFIDLFRYHQFIRDYGTAAGLEARLNGVLQRVKLKPLPAGTRPVLERCRELVAPRAAELLPGIYPLPETDTPDPRQGTTP